MKPLIINLAPTGLVSSREQSSHIPITPAEISADVVRCIELGVSMVHLHARNPDGSPSDDSAVTADIIRRIRTQAPDVVIVCTTSGRRSKELKHRAASLYIEGDAKPDMASLTLGSMNFAKDASINDPKSIVHLAEIMKERGIRPELEVFDLGMINLAKILADKKLIEPPFYFNLLLGNPGTAQATLLHLATLVSDLPPQSYWSLAGIGRFQTTANALGVVMGNGVRTGLEDNLWLDDKRTKLASNIQLVERIVAQSTAIGRPIAPAKMVRELLGLTQ